MARTQRPADTHAEKIGQRLIQALTKNFGLTMTQASNHLGYANPTTLHKIRRGMALPDPGRLAKFAREQSINRGQTLNLHWILTGQGVPMIDRRKQPASDRGVGTEDDDIINSLRRLDPEFKQAVRVLVLSQAARRRKR